MQLTHTTVGGDIDVHIDAVYQVINPPPLYVGVPSMPNYFIGRDELVGHLVQHLISGSSFALSTEGLPGVGKTTLAVALAHHQDVLHHFTDGVLWVGLGQQPDVLGTLAIWAEALGRNVLHLVTAAERAQAVKDAIGQRHLLLVIDDAWQVDAAKLLRCGGPNCCHLLTTRDKWIARAFAGAAHTDSVPVLGDDTAYQLLQALAPNACRADSVTARALVTAVGGLPLAVELLGGYLEAPERSFFPELSTEALADLTDPRRRLQLAAQRLGARGDIQMTLQEIIALSMEGLPELVKCAFYALGAFASKPQWFDRAAAEAVTEADLATLALLVARNLVDIADKAQLALHQTLADVARMKLDAETIKRHRDYYLALVNENPKDWRRIEAVYGQISWAWAAQADNEELFEFFYALIDYQERRGLGNDTLEWAQRCFHFAERTNRRLGLACTFSNIGAAYIQLRQAQQALEYLQQAQSIAEEMGEQAQLIRCLTNLNIGSVYSELLKQPQQALEYFQQARSIAEEIGDQIWLSISFTNVGWVYSHLLRQPQQALEYFQQALAIQEEIGIRYEEIITRHNMTTIYEELGQFTDAVAQLTRVVELEALLHHPDLEYDTTRLHQLKTTLATQVQETSSGRWRWWWRY